MMADMSAFMSKLKELKMKMAELENMEEQLPGADQASADSAEGPIEGLEEKLGIDKPEDSESPPDESGQIGDDDMMEMMGKKKKLPPKAGMKIAIAVGKSKGKPLFGKYK